MLAMTVTIVLKRALKDNTLNVGSDEQVIYMSTWAKVISNWAGIPDSSNVWQRLNGDNPSEKLVKSLNVRAF
jgi:hypothetical protein